METRPVNTIRRLTLSDHISVLLNCLGRVHGILKEALTEMRNDICVDLRFVNGRIYSAVILSQSLLDGVVALASSSRTRLNFDDFVFDNTSVAWIDSVQKKINELRFDGQSFTELAQSMRHTPWIICSVRRGGRDQILDYYVKGNGFMYGLMLPLYNHIHHILCRLATQFGVECASIPTM